MNLGLMPLANNLLKSDKEEAEKFPLSLLFCQKCYLVQLKDIVPPEKLFREYVYLSSMSKTFLEHARNLAEKLIRERGLGKESFVVEIGSNDGYLLQFFLQKGIEVLGIEPAKNISEIANQKGIRTIPEFFDLNLAWELSRRKKADIIIANNVLAHIPDIDGVIRGIGELLKDDGVFVAEFPYVKDMIEKNEFDTIYHEHVYYFSLSSVRNIFNSRGLKLFDFEYLPNIHGGSLRIFVGKKQKESKRLMDAISDEEKTGLKSKNFYYSFSGRVEEIKKKLIELISGIEDVAGYGASAKATILLNYVGLDRNKIKFIADKNPLKQGRYVPGVKIPIFPPEKIYEENIKYLFILVWNIKEEIMNQERKFKQKGGKFIVPIPEPTII